MSATAKGYIGVILCIIGYILIGVILRLYRDNGKENGSYYSIASPGRKWVYFIRHGEAVKAVWDKRVHGGVSLDLLGLWKSA